jgi:hypothetical protein
MAGDGASEGLWGCSVVGAAAVVHLWGAGGGASLEGRRWRHPTRRALAAALAAARQHVNGTLVIIIVGCSDVGCGDSGDSGDDDGGDSGGEGDGGDDAAARAMAMAVATMRAAVATAACQL